ncbi:hypothetical protein NC653_021262 [Populus alba x Populus x berolinensis]|uniref:Uncharacterized protein n=1 Tax=Populus alba x Populus x berolinensis TaxID=444605 RepID=A0AAD6MPE3_9ROSI|nr:hypothetical protein NC653_021262 [Populus alba x Populus x berolinensis]
MVSRGGVSDLNLSAIDLVSTELWLDNKIFYKLCQSFGGDAPQALFSSSEGLASLSPENMRFWILRFISDQASATAFQACLLWVSFFSQAITSSTCIVAHNNALLVSNNFAEIKSNVFKRLSKDNICSLVCSGLVVSCKYCRAIANHQIP